MRLLLLLGCWAVITGLLLLLLLRWWLLLRPDRLRVDVWAWTHAAGPLWLGCRAWWVDLGVWVWL